MTVVTLSDADVRRLAPVAEVIAKTRMTLSALQDGQFEVPLRHVFDGGSAVVMPAYHQASGAVIVKTLTLNPSRDPVIDGTVTWSSKNVDTVVVAAAATLTAIRTGAIVGVALDVLADPDARRATVFGVGAQAADQVRAILAVRKVERITLVSRSDRKAARLADTLREEFPDTTILATTEPLSDLRHSDIVCCATNTQKPLFAADDLADDVAICAIGSFRPDMAELPVDLLSTASPVVVDDISACLAEAGELIDAIGVGALSVDRLTPLGRLLDQSNVPYRGRRVFKSVGIAAQDWAAMSVVSEKLVRRDSVEATT